MQKKMEASIKMDRKELFKIVDLYLVMDTIHWRALWYKCGLHKNLGIPQTDKKIISFHKMTLFHKKVIV
jgi:hypothetical protein